MDLDEQLPVIEISDKFTKDKLIQNKENKEVKSKKDDKTASTPLVTVSDLQRMKQFEVIILRMRKQPFKTKFTPFFKLDWGTKYPPAKYPVRKKQELKTFDIKEFVKNQKKKKLLEMMNSADQQDKENTSLPKLPGMFRNNEAHNSLPPELQAARNNRKEQERNNIPDFTSKPRESSADTSVRGIPDFETFKKQMEANQAFNPFEIPKETPTTRVPSIPTTPITSAPTTASSNPFMSNSSNDDDFGFDVDELVKKIDAKIAELEAEEKKEEEERKKKESLAQPTTAPATVATTPIHSINDIYSEKPAVKETSVVEKPNPLPNLDLDDDNDDDFFDDFFDN